MEGLLFGKLRSKGKNDWSVGGCNAILQKSRNLKWEYCLQNRFYDQTGDPTEYFRQIDRKIQFGLKQQQEETQFNSEFPSCNVEYKADTGGTRFWCTNVSCILTKLWPHDLNFILAIWWSLSWLGRISHPAFRSRHKNISSMHMYKEREFRPASVKAIWQLWRFNPKLCCYARRTWKRWLMIPKGGTF